MQHATIQAVLGEVIAETVAECTALDAEQPVVHAVGPTSGECLAALECLPLTQVLGIAVDPGHLHRPATTEPPARTPSARPPVPLDVIALLVASRAGRDLLDVRLAHAEHQLANLTVALESNRTIGVAVGILMSTRRCTELEAFDLMRSVSQSENRKLREIAGEVVWAGDILDSARATG